MTLRVVGVSSVGHGPISSRQDGFDNTEKPVFNYICFFNMCLFEYVNSDSISKYLSFFLQLRHPEGLNEE